MIDTVLNTFAETLFGYTTDESVSTVLSNPQYYSSETPIFLKIDTLSLKKTLLEQDTCPLTIETALLSHCEDVLTQGVGFFIKLHCPLFLMWLKDCYSRCLADCIKVSPKFRNILRKLQEKNGVDLSCIQTLVLRFAVLSFQCPFFFIQSDDKDYDQNELDELTAESVILLYETTSNTNQFLSALFECLEKESQEDFEKVICNVLSHFKKKISSKKELKSVNDNTFNSLCMFINTEKNIPRIVGQQLSVKQKNLLTKQKKSFAVALASCTLLGNILWFTPLDAIHFVHDPSRSCSQQYFNLNICQNARHLAKSIDNVRENALQVVDTAHIFVTLLCRNGARYECLEWISSIAKGNQKRVQQGISSQLEFFSTMSVSMEAFALQYHGFTGSGFNFNLFWMCLKLLEPIKLHKTSSIEIEYLLSEEAQTLLQPYLSESRLCFLEELHELEVGFRASPENKKTPKFSTQIFFVSFLCLRYLFRPLLNEFSHLRELLHSRQSEMASSKHSTPRQKSYHELLGEYMCFQSLIAHPMFLKSWWYFVDLTVTWLFKQLDITSFTMPNNTKNFQCREEKENLNQASTSSHSKILPYCILEDIAESVRFFLSLPSTPSFPSDPIVPAIFKSLSLINEKKLAEFFLFIFRSDDIIRNPHCRWSCGYEPFSELHGHFYFGVRVDNMDIVIQHLIPTLVKAFIDAQKDGYYVRLRRRLSFTVHLGRLLELNAFIDSLKQFVTNAQTNETFIKFMAMLVESMTWLLEEGMSALAEVKKREKFQVSTDSQELLDTNQQLPSTTTASANDEQRANNANDEFDTQSIDQGHNVSEIPFQQLERLCKSLTDAGLRTIQVVATIAKIFGDIIVDSPILLLQVTTSLNCCLEHLIGPRCLELKVSCFEKYNFDPKALLATTIMIYISLASFDTDTKEKIIHSVCNDTRYFKKTVFKKAFYIASREELLSSKHLETFSEIILLLEKTSDILNAEEKWLEEIWDEIPDEYKDPIMDNLMEDPVKLPTSGHIMDRKTIERHLMTEEFDPYNRMALKFTDLIPQDELRLQIKEFVKKKRSHYSSQKLNTI